MKKKNFVSPIIVALDFSNEKQAITFSDKISPRQCKLKVGKELFIQSRSSLIERLQLKGFDIFLDLKLHDIPNTVAKSVIALAKMGVWAISVHAIGGKKMLTSARSALNFCSNVPILLSVTVLTSLNNMDLLQLGINKNLLDYVLYLSKISKESGIDGVICSAFEAKEIKKKFGKDFVVATPGIRFSKKNNDQKRVAHPMQAIKFGSDYIIIGRDVIKSTDPYSKLEDILTDYRNIFYR